MLGPFFIFSMAHFCFNFVIHKRSVAVLELVLEVNVASNKYSDSEKENKTESIFQKSENSKILWEWRRETEGRREGGREGRREGGREGRRRKEKVDSRSSVDLMLLGTNALRTNTAIYGSDNPNDNCKWGENPTNSDDDGLAAF